MDRLYRVGEFAALTGVSIRTLHHYDQIGLLHPSAHSEAGYRFYSEGDLLCLQQILTLRYLGFPLKQIGKLLRRPDFDLVASMNIQRGVLRERIAELERIQFALSELLDRRQATGRWAWELVVKASQAVQDGLAQKGDQMEAYYTPEQMKQFEELGKRVPVEEREAIERDWAVLLAEVRANPDLDPASPQAQELGARWDALRERTMRPYQQFAPELLKAIGENYRQGRFEGQMQAPQRDDVAFFERVKAARKAQGESSGA
ncbi:MAG TPA: MerR family transcriptional regulator [Chloroflexota bacterium]|jgi:DNA-binding transcriptional MerR regulator